MTRIKCFAALTVALLLFSSCAASPISHTGTYMDTVCTVTVYDGDDSPLTACFDTVKEWEARWSRTVATSDIARLNAADGKPVTVHPETAALLRQASDYTALTRGAFDVTTASLTDVWKAAQAADTLPETAALEAALSRVGTDNVRIDGEQVTLSGGTQLDLGAIAKGAVADKAAATLRASGCQSALLDFGGNIIALGTKNGKPFRVGIADPRDDGTLIATVSVSDTAVVTSGSYERGYTVGGKRYSHILDPQSGQPVENDLLSVTVLAPTAADADALSTACFVLGYDKASALIDSLDGIEAVFVTADGAVVTTDGVTLV